MPNNNEPKKIQNRTLRPGDVLLKPGDRVASVYIVQSGRLAVFQNRSSQLIEIAQLAAPECIGEESVFGPVSWSLQVTATRDTTVLEIPTTLIPEQIKATPPHTRELFKALNERAKALLTELRTTRGDRGTTACPPDETAKTFSILFHSMRIIGKEGKIGETGVTTANWKEVLTFANDIFGENEVRFESAAQILVRLDYAEMDASGENYTVKAMRTLENFVDYYGGYHFKGGYANLLKTHPKMTRITQEMLKLVQDPSIGAKVDRGGVAHLPYKPAVDALKQAIQGFEADQIFRLEQKGLFVKRTATNDGGVLSFLKMDFEQMLENWGILREVEIWNENGYVDPPRDLFSPQAIEMDRKRFGQMLANWKPLATHSSGPPTIRTGTKKIGEIWCEVCMSVCKPMQKTCDVCGSEIQKKAA
jgi:CRP-like cAMP-binding protein